MLLRSLLTLLSFLFLFSSCATLKLSNREKIYSVTALGFTGGTVYGLSHKQAKGKNAILFGSSFALIASLISLAVFNEEKKVKELENKLSQLEEDLGLRFEGSKIKYLTGGKNYLTKKDVPEEIKPFISSGEWHLFELEKSQPVEVWTPVGKNRLVKKNKMFELKVPKLKEN